MDICHLKNAELEPKYQKYKGRVVLRRDIVKDDSGAQEVFTEQGSSASQNDGRRSDGCNCKTTWLCRTGSRCSICLLPGKDGGRSKIAQHSAECPDYGCVFHDRSGSNHSETSKIQWFISNEICMDTHLLVSCGKDSSRTFSWNLDGKKCRNVLDGRKCRTENVVSVSVRG